MIKYQNVKRSGSTRFVIEEKAGNKVIGKIRVAYQQSPYGPEAWFHDMFVDKRYRRREIASKLTLQAIKRSGTKIQRLSIWADNEKSLGLAQKMGFIIEKEVPQGKYKYYYLVRHESS